MSDKFYNQKKELSFNLAIDGTSASGKSSIAKFIAKELNFIHINSGNLYRSIAAYFAIYYNMDFDIFNNSLRIKDEELKKEAKGIILISRKRILESEFMDIINNLINNNKLDEIAFNLNVINNTYDLNGQNISEFIRTPLITNITMIIAQIKIVRTFSNLLQMKFISKNKLVVCDGRDIGTNVMPKAHLKLFISCNAEIRAKRRLLELGNQYNFETVLKDIKARDKMDIERKEGPLLKSNDAVEYDTGNKSEEECFSDILKIVLDRMKSCGF